MERCVPPASTQHPEKMHARHYTLIRETVHAVGFLEVFDGPPRVKDSFWMRNRRIVDVMRQKHEPSSQTAIRLLWGAFSRSTR